MTNYFVGLYCITILYDRLGTDLSDNYLWSLEQSLLINERNMSYVLEWIYIKNDIDLKTILFKNSEMGCEVKSLHILVYV